MTDHPSARDPDPEDVAAAHRLMDRLQGQLPDRPWVTHAEVVAALQRSQSDDADL
jgi:hypothetical protein